MSDGPDPLTHRGTRRAPRTGPDLAIRQVPEGALLVLSGVDFPDAETANEISRTVTDRVRDAAGHDRFALLVLSGTGTLDVWTLDDDDLDEKLDRLLAATRTDQTRRVARQETTASGPKENQ